MSNREKVEIPPERAERISVEGIPQGSTRRAISFDRATRILRSGCRPAWTDEFPCVFAPANSNEPATYPEPPGWWVMGEILLRSTILKIHEESREDSRYSTRTKEQARSFSKQGGQHPGVLKATIQAYGAQANMALVPSKNKLKMGSAGRYYGAYLIYDVANSCLAALHAKMPPSVVVTRTNPPSPVHVQNPRKDTGAIHGRLEQMRLKAGNEMSANFLNTQARRPTYILNGSFHSGAPFWYNMPVVFSPPDHYEFFKRPTVPQLAPNTVTNSGLISAESILRLTLDM
ncbi:hypothetical protein KM043_006534 [Ampulex compressa]|nr:hypothetical protein KM043_006534 [Ampulex compressa]